MIVYTFDLRFIGGCGVISVVSKLLIFLEVIMTGIRPLDEVLSRVELPVDVYEDMHKVALIIASAVKRDIENGRVFPPVMEAEVNDDELSTVTVRIKGENQAVHVEFERCSPLKIVTATAVPFVS